MKLFAIVFVTEYIVNVRISTVFLRAVFLSVIAKLRSFLQRILSSIKTGF